MNQTVQPAQDGDDVDFQSLSRKAYAQLSQWLTTGRLRPGERLVNRAIASQMGLSMTPVREAIYRLISDGVVEHVDGAGVRVRRISHRDALQLYEIRCLLEPTAAGQAAENANQYQLDEIGRVCERGMEILNEVHDNQDSIMGEPFSQLSAADAEFHELIIRAANNSWLERSLLGTRFVLKMFFAHFAAMQSIPTASMRQTWNTHKKLHAAIRTRNRDKSQILMQRHLQLGEQNFRTWIMVNSRGTDVG